MKKHARKKRRLEVVGAQSNASVDIPVPLLGALRSARKDFLALCVDTGRQVLSAMMEQEREALCEPKWLPNPDRTGLRGGSVPSEVTLGGRKVPIRRLRARSLIDGAELELESASFFSSTDPLNDQTLRAIARGVSTRGYRGVLESLPEDERERSISRSSVSRRFVALSVAQLRDVLSAPLNDLDLRVVMIDGIAFSGHVIVIALGIMGDGRKQVLSLHEGATENSTVVRVLLEGLIERGLVTDRPLLFVIDGAKALRKGIREIFGSQGLVHRCHVHKLRNVLDQLPEAVQPRVRRAMHEAWAMTDARKAEKKLRTLADSLAADHPGATESLREGLTETLTLTRLGVSAALFKTLSSTNPIENLNSSIARFARNVKHWQGGAMILRWVGAAVIHAQTGFRRLRGYRAMERLTTALDALINHNKLDQQRQAA